MEEKVNGIVLRSVDYMDYDSILSIFTLEKGVLTAKMKGVKRSGAKLKFASEPFCFAEFVLAERNGKRTVTGVTLADGFYALRDNFESFMCASVIMEFLQKFCLDNVPMPELFHCAIKSLSYIAYKDNPKISLIKFLLDALAVCGYGLNFEGCSSCGVVIESPKIFFDTNGGGFLCENCYVEGSPEVSRESFEALLDIAEDNDADITPERQIRLLRFMDFYVFNKAGESVNSLKLLLKNSNF